MRSRQQIPDKTTVGAVIIRPIYHNIIYSITVAAVEHDLVLSKDTPYLALTGELCGFYCKDCGKKLPCFYGTALYVTENW